MERKLATTALLLVITTGCGQQGFTIEDGEALRPCIPCEEPLTYRLGSWDDNFELSRHEALRIVRAAEDQWERAAGRNLFAYSPADGLATIDLVNDGSIEWAREAMRIATRLKQLEADPRQADTFVAQPGAAEEADALIRRLESFPFSEEFRAAEFASQTMIVTSRTGPNSRTIVSHRYRRAAIRLRTYFGLADLTHAMLHELGHSLGLPHLKDEGAVMGRVGENDWLGLIEEPKRPVLSAADIAALKAVIRDSS